jgi:hypothetical protein
MPATFISKVSNGLTGADARTYVAYYAGGADATATESITWADVLTDYNTRFGTSYTYADVSDGAVPGTNPNATIIASLLSAGLPADPTDPNRPAFIEDKSVKVWIPASYNAISIGCWVFTSEGDGSAPLTKVDINFQTVAKADTANMKNMLLLMAPPLVTTFIGEVSNGLTGADARTYAAYTSGSTEQAEKGTLVWADALSDYNSRYPGTSGYAEVSDAAAVPPNTTTAHLVSIVDSMLNTATPGVAGNTSPNFAGNGGIKYWIPDGTYEPYNNCTMINASNNGSEIYNNQALSSFNTQQTDALYKMVLLLKVPDPQTPPGAICFLEGTQVVTDQGEMAIEAMTAQNTVNGKAVVGITMQTSTEDMVLLKQGALGESVPSQDTYVTKDHGIFLNGTMIKAGKLVDGVDVVEVNMGQRNIYNVLLKTHEKMVVHNMDVESLDPEHPKAKYCLMGAKAQEQDQVVKLA